MKEICFCAILLIAWVSSDEGKRTENRRRQQQHGNSKLDHHPHEWDFLVFTQEWPPVGCISWQVLNPSHKCNITKDVTTWTVHGVWPSSTSGSSPSFCNSSSVFNISEIQSIKPALKKYWPNLYANTPEDQLWAHEWDKHGTCAASLPALGSELLFFDCGVSWVKKYNMLNILGKAGITPNPETPVLAYDIELAVKHALGVKPLLMCEYVPKNKTWFIFEIELCFNKDLVLINCPKTLALEFLPVLGTEECPHSQLVWYPPIRRTHSLQNDDVNSIPRLEKLLKNVLRAINILL